MGRGLRDGLAVALGTLAPVLASGACIPAALTLEAAGDASTTDSAVADASGNGDGGPGCCTDGPGQMQDTGAPSGDAATGDACTSGCGPTGCACVSPAPPGWTYVAFDPTARAACPADYGGTAVDVVVDPGLGPSTCACSCPLTSPPTCLVGPITHMFGNDSSCGMTGPTYDADDGGCVAQTLGYAFGYHEGTGPAATGGSCGTPVVTATPPSGGSSGKTCDLSASVQGGCGAGQVCAPATPSPFQVCISRAGALACPSGFSTSHTVGTSVTPGGCGSCSCTPAADCAGTFTVFYDSMCQDVLASIPADGTCHATPGITDAGASYQYSATESNAGCSVTQAPQPTGSATLAGLTTVCCP